MTLREMVRSAAVEIASHKVRSALTCLSLAIGIAAILFTFSAIGGMNRRLDKWRELSGPGRIEIKKKRNFISRGLSPGLTWDDAQEIRKNFPDLHMVYPMVRRWQTRIATPGFSSKEIVIWGTTDEWRKREWVYTLRGRFLTADDVKNSGRVAVILEPGGWVVKPFWAKYFPEKALDKALKHQEFLGRAIRLDDHDFTVVGIIKAPPRDKDPRWGHDGYGGSGDILVPVTSYYRYLLPGYDKNAAGKVDEIEIDTGSEQTVGVYLKRIQSLIDARHRREKDVDIKDYREIIQGAQSRMRQRALAILVIGVVAIVAGGIGIMNVTLATMFSRIREIGIRRALGATRLDIITQFVVEAVGLALAGGAAGTGLGFLAVRYLSPDLDDMAAIGLVQIAAALGIAVGTGFLFSLFPAYQASKLDPIEALRYE